MSGYRTYILAAVGAIGTALWVLGIIDEKVYVAIMGFVNSGAVATIRAGMKNDTKAVEETVKVETHGIAETPKRDLSSGQYQSRKE